MDKKLQWMEVTHKRIHSWGKDFVDTRPLAMKVCESKRNCFDCNKSNKSISVWVTRMMPIWISVLHCPIQASATVIDSIVSNSLITFQKVYFGSRALDFFSLLRCHRCRHSSSRIWIAGDSVSVRMLSRVGVYWLELSTVCIYCNSIQHVYYHVQCFVRGLKVWNPPSTSRNTLSFHGWCNGTLWKPILFGSLETNSLWLMHLQF